MTFPYIYDQGFYKMRVVPQVSTEAESPLDCRGYIEVVGKVEEIFPDIQTMRRYYHDVALRMQQKGYLTTIQEKPEGDPDQPDILVSFRPNWGQDIDKKYRLLTVLEMQTDLKHSEKEVLHDVEGTSRSMFHFREAVTRALQPVRVRSKETKLVQPLKDVVDGIIIGTAYRYEGDRYRRHHTLPTDGLKATLSHYDFCGWPSEGEDIYSSILSLVTDHMPKSWGRSKAAVSASMSP